MRATSGLLAAAALFGGASAANGLYDRAISLMESSPLVDTHVDLPQILRSLCEFKKACKTTPQDTDVRH